MLDPFFEKRFKYEPQNRGIYLYPQNISIKVAIFKPIMSNYGLNDCHEQYQFIPLNLHLECSNLYPRSYFFYPLTYM